jgi:hypothetical protein
MFWRDVQSAPGSLLTGAAVLRALDAPPSAVGLLRCGRMDPQRSVWITRYEAEEMIRELRAAIGDATTEDNADGE